MSMAMGAHSSKPGGSVPRRNLSAHPWPNGENLDVTMSRTRALELCACVLNLIFSEILLI